MATRKDRWHEEAILKKKDLYIHTAERCAKFLMENYKVKKIFLVGSLVRGVFHERSDIDLVVEGIPEKLYIKALTDLYDLLLPSMELNLIPFEDAFDTLKEETLKKGRLLYG